MVKSRSRGSRTAQSRGSRVARSSPPVDVELSLVDARRLALVAQGFGRTYEGSEAARLSQVLDHVGVLQIDSVNVLVRSHELPIFARIGHHDRAAIAGLMAKRKIFEYWVHEASLASVELHPNLRWRMARPHPWLGNYYSGNKALVERLYRRIRDDGALKAADVSMRVGKKGSWWDWDDAKRALEYLFYAGRVTTRARDNSFARIYDLPERMLPASVLKQPTPSELDARRELLLLAVDHLGVATFGDLCDYHRQRPRDARPALDSLIDDGSIRLAQVEDWNEPAYVSKRIPAVGRIRECALLSPFDSLVWNRERNERLFDFYYRIEIYTPKPKRRFGYYVLPVLHDERLVGRLDLKADRHAKTLRVEGAYVEPGTSATRVTTPIASELRRMAQWLSLERVVVGRRGNLAARLSRAVASRIA